MTFVTCEATACLGGGGGGGVSGVQVRGLPDWAQTRPHRGPLCHRSPLIIHIVRVLTSYPRITTDLFSSRVRVGEYDLSPEKEGKEDCDTHGYCAPLPQVIIFTRREINRDRAQDFEPVEVIIHPEYNKPGKFQNDIAIIKLDRDIKINGLKTFFCLIQIEHFCRLRVPGVSPLPRDDARPL